MKNAKWNLLLAVFLLGCVSMNAQCFTMQIEERRAKKGSTCLQITVDILGTVAESVEISDDFGNFTTCNSDCSFIWCYPVVQQQTSNQIVCVTGPTTVDGGCYQLEGCIVVIGGGG